MVLRGCLALLAILVLALAGCQQVIVFENVTNNVTEPAEDIEEPVAEEPEPPSKAKEPVEDDFAAIVTGVEGELIELEPEAIDPDGDAVRYIFSEPFNENGRWQTRLGDEGDYLVTVKAYDGVDYNTVDILVRVKRADRPPVLDCPETIAVKEGEKIEIDCNVFDPEGNEVVVIYRGFMTTSQYQTNFRDAGTYTVQVTAWDKQHVGNKVQDTITIEVVDVNRPPEVLFSIDTEMTAVEGDIVNVKPIVNDPDDDEITIRYSSPFDRNGIWRTKVGDRGTYDASIVVSDGENQVRKDFQVVIEELNTPPVIEEIPDIYVAEGETIKLDIQVTDREQEDLFIDIEGFMTGTEYTTTYEDAWPEGCPTKGCTATYTLTITATDGELVTEQDVKIHVRDKNRPPVFRVPA